MRCPFCHDLENRVVDSRLGKEGDAIRRRRHCEHCGRRFTTYERVEESLPMVVKKDGRREPFERAKIVNGLKRACEKRPVPVDTIEALVDKIERQLQEGGEREVTSRAIGETVMRELHALDAVAYVRFASVYRSFRDVHEFMRELEDLISERRGKPRPRAAARRLVRRPRVPGHDFHVAAQFRPAAEPVLAGDHQLRVGQRDGRQGPGIGVSKARMELAD